MPRASHNPTPQELEATQKDLYYYKQSYRELKRKLKQIQVAVKNDLDKSTKEVWIPKRISLGSHVGYSLRVQMHH